MKITPKSSIGIIGGRGRTGGQFARLLKQAGFSVTVTGKDDARQNRAILDRCDVVLFSLPLKDAASIIRSELRDAHRKDQLILDVSSLKTDQVQAMLTAPGEVIGMHPLFGPGTDPTGELVILCPARAKSGTIASLKRLLASLKLKTQTMTPEAHDELMGMVQAIPHLKSLLMADVLRALGADLHKALRTCTPTYELEFNVIGRFLDDHADLYMPIIFSNPEIKKILRTLKRTINQYIAIADRRDLPAAEARYRACKRTFSPFLKQARSHSEACISTLLSLSR